MAIGANLMARAIEDIEQEIRKLSQEDKERLYLHLMDELAELPPDAEALVREFAEAMQKMHQALQAAVASFDGLEERLERGRREAREEVLRSGESWPFAEPPSLDIN